MTRISGINIRIKSYILLSDVEISTDGIILPFEESMTINPSKYKRLGLRKINCLISDKPDYPFSIDLVLTIDMIMQFVSNGLT
jgi:hypothetical protein